MFILRQPLFYLTFHSVSKLTHSFHLLSWPTERKIMRNLQNHPFFLSFEMVGKYGAFKLAIECQNSREDLLRLF